MEFTKYLKLARSLSLQCLLGEKDKGDLTSGRQPKCRVEREKVASEHVQRGRENWIKEEGGGVGWN